MMAIDQTVTNQEIVVANLRVCVELAMCALHNFTLIHN